MPTVWRMDPDRTFIGYVIVGGEIQLRQPYIRLTGFLNKAPKLFSSVASRPNKGGHRGCTPK